MDATVKTIMKLRERHVTKALKKHAARHKQAASIMASIRKEYGKDSMMQLVTGEDDDSHVPCISTGRHELDDWLTGREDSDTLEVIPHTGGGLPRGRIIEIYGPESSGKTTFCLHIIAAAQKQGELCAFIDAEHALDKHWARKMGVDIDELLFSQPDNGEQAMEIAESLVRKKMGVIVIDSVAALVPKKELEEGSREPGLQARLMSKSLRKLASLCEKSGTIIIFINQLRMKIGVMFGNPETTTGGNALKFYASIRIDVRFGGQLKKKIKGKERAFGILMRLKGVKNKVASPFRMTRAKLVWGIGFTDIGEDLKA